MEFSITQKIYGAIRHKKRTMASAALAASTIERECIFTSCTEHCGYKSHVLGKYSFVQLFSDNIRTKKLKKCKVFKSTTYHFGANVLIKFENVNHSKPSALMDNKYKCALFMNEVSLRYEHFRVILVSSEAAFFFLLKPRESKHDPLFSPES